MTPLPWSYTALEDFVGCPRRYYEVRVAKSVPDSDHAHRQWGSYVHKAFEDRQRLGRPLPDDLAEHEWRMQVLEEAPGDLDCERRVAIDRKLRACGFFGDLVWWRGVIDWMKVDREYAMIVDYKTGRQHSKFGQLKLFALWAFAAFPGLKAVDVRFYWTKTRQCTGERYVAQQVPDLWQQFLPDLRQYAQAFKDETFVPRPSGLCGWCPVTACEFWKPRRKP